MIDETPVEYVDQDVLIEISHLRQPFVDDLVGVLMGAAVDGTDANGRPKLSPMDSLRLLVDRIMALVDLLADEIVGEAMAQMAEQMGGHLIEDDLFVPEGE